MNKPNLNHRLLISLLFVFYTAVSASSQPSASPFDLLPRLHQHGYPDSTIMISTSSNPFDLIEILPADRPSTPSTGFTVEQTRKPLTAREKSALYQRFLFVTILTMMVILTLVVTIFRIFINKIWKAFHNDNLLSQLLREKSAGITLAYFILYVVFFINAGIFLFLACRHFDIAIAGSNLASLFVCIGSVAGFYLVKHALLLIIRYIFPLEKEVARYDFTIVVFNIILGFALVPMIMFAAYAPEKITSIIIYATVGLVASTLIFRALRGLFIANRFFAWHKFHFFLYLCSVEIAPVLIIVKLLNLH